MHIEQINVFFDILNATLGQFYLHILQHDLNLESNFF